MKLKIRFWSLLDNKMMSDSDLEEHSLQSIRDWEGELMLFTGLKDKNKKEIYEGDILKSESWGSNSRLTRKGKHSYHIVEWGACGWVAKGYNGDMEVRPDLNVKSDFEIIGNIYENRELINE